MWSALIRDSEGGDGVYITVSFLHVQNIPFQINHVITDIWIILQSMKWARADDTFVS